VICIIILAKNVGMDTLLSSAQLSQISHLI